MPDELDTHFSIEWMSDVHIARSLLHYLQDGNELRTRLLSFPKEAIACVLVHGLDTKLLTQEYAWDEGVYTNPEIQKVFAGRKILLIGLLDPNTPDFQYLAAVAGNSKYVRMVID